MSIGTGDPRASEGLKEVRMYTDGACSGNPGPGGWACILIYGEHEKVLSGYDPRTTNNKMELQGPIEGLQALRERCIVQAYTDSRYVCDAFNKHWISNWKRHGWMRTKTEPVKNSNLWKQLDALCSHHIVAWHHVKGHADNEYNNRCDRIATDEVAKRRQHPK